MPATRDKLNTFLNIGQPPVPYAKSGPLSGLALGVKDIFDVAGMVTGCGNPAKAEQAEPALLTAPAVQRLLDSGARLIGKTQTEELAFSMIGQNVHFPHPVNPRAPGRVTGGSSSGSAAAVAGGLADIATGSDTGGSIRIPASFCGLVGLRTTHGRISLEGAMPLAPSFDTFGWFARDAAIYEAVGEVMLGTDRHGAALTRPMRLGALDELVPGAAERAEYERMAESVAETTALPAPVSLDAFPTDTLFETVRDLQAKEAWAAHGDWIKAHGKDMDPATRDRFVHGSTVSLARATEAGAVRKAFRAALRDLLAEDGFIVMPTVPSAAPRSDSTADQFLAFRALAVRLACWSGLSGFPQITLPLGAVDGAPFGISLLGPPDSDMALIRLGRTIMAHAGIS